VATVGVAVAAAATTSGAMTDHVVRLYALSLAALVFLVSWAVVAARPWAATEAERDPRVVRLERREALLARRQVQVQRLLERRFAAYRRRLSERERQQASLAAAPAAPSVQVTSLPAVTETGSS
jgi:hypothetical protein